MINREGVDLGEIFKYPRNNTMDNIAGEVDKAREKFENKDPKELFWALVEEVGEVSRAYMDGEGNARLYAEAIQVAAMAVRIAEELAHFGEG